MKEFKINGMFSCWCMYCGFYQITVMISWSS